MNINDAYISDQSGILGLARACAITLRRFRNRKRITRDMLSYACSSRADRLGGWEELSEPQR